jgi:predicted peptidase
MRRLPLLLPAGLLLGLAPSACADKKDDLARLEKHTFRQGSASLPYRLLKPAGLAKAKTKRYPLVIFLHGAGERGTDNEKQLVHGVADFASKEARAKYPCFLVAPQCPEGKRWVEVDWTLPAHTMPSEPSEPAKLLLALIASLRKEYPIDDRRIYLTGLSMGGFGVWDLLCRRPELFAAGLPVCGGGDEKQARKIAGVSVWAFHGDKDGVVKVERSRNMVKAVEEAGGKPRYTEYPGVDHDSWTRTYHDPKVLAWLFAQKKE